MRAACHPSVGEARSFLHICPMGSCGMGRPKGRVRGGEEKTREKSESGEGLRMGGSVLGPGIVT